MLSYQKAAPCAATAPGSFPRPILPCPVLPANAGCMADTSRHFCATRARRLLRAICAKHGVPYVQESVFKRLGKTVDIMVGATSSAYSAHDSWCPMAEVLIAG